MSVSLWVLWKGERKEKTTDNEISPSLHNRINLINTNTLSDEKLMMAGIG